MVALVRNDKSSRTSMSYARYLVCIREERWLDAEEEVDHIDDNKLNDDIDNLQLLSKPENIRKTATTGRTMITLVCPNCDTEFIRERRLVVYNKTRKHPPCCSRSCSSKYQRANGPVVQG